MTEYNLLADHEEYDDDRFLDDGELSEADLEVYEEVWDSGGSTKKIDIRGRESNGTEGIGIGEYIDVVKKYPEARHTYTDDENGYELHQATVEYKDEEVQFTMYGDDAKKFNATGGQGDTVRIRKRKIWNTQREGGYSRYEFIKQE